MATNATDLAPQPLPHLNDTPDKNTLAYLAAAALDGEVLDVIIT